MSGGSASPAACRWPRSVVARIGYATPWEILRQLPGLAGHLKPELTIEELERASRARTDTQAAEKNAASQTQTLREFPSEAKRVKQLWQRLPLVGDERSQNLLRTSLSGSVSGTHEFETYPRRVPGDADRKLLVESARRHPAQSPCTICGLELRYLDDCAHHYGFETQGHATQSSIRIHDGEPHIRVRTFSRPAI